MSLKTHHWFQPVHFIIGYLSPGIELASRKSVLFRLITPADGVGMTTTKAETCHSQYHFVFSKFAFPW